MSFLAALIVFAITTILSWAYQRFIAKKPKLEAETWQTPPVAAGTDIPVLLGTQRVPIIPVCYIGEQRIDIIGGGNFTTGKQVIGQNHLVTYQGLLCWGPINSYVNFVVNDSLLASRMPARRQTYLSADGVVSYSTQLPISFDHDAGGIGLLIWAGGKVKATVYMPDIFQKFDGIGGEFMLYFGTGQTSADPTLEAAKGAGNVPDYRELAYVVFNKFRMGMDPSRPLNLILTKGAMTGIYDGFVRARQIDDGPIYALAGYTPWTQTDVTIPAALYALVKDKRWAIGMDISEVDVGQWTGIDGLTNGGQYATETTGISAIITSSAQAKALRDEWLAILNAKLIRHPETNLYQIKLIRNETPDQAAIDALRTFDEDDIRSCKISQRQWSETYNEVTVEFSNPALIYQKDVVIARNDASIAATGRTRKLKLTMMSVTDPLLAQRIALRELRASSTVLEKQTLNMTRAAWDLTEGDVFKINYAPVGYANRVLRCLSKSLGRPWANEVIIEAIDDVYAHAEPPMTLVQRDPMPPGPVAPRDPVISFIYDYTATQAIITLVIEDPDNRVLSKSYAVSVGHLELVSADGGYQTISGNQITVTRDDVDHTYVHLSVAYLDRNTASAEWTDVVDIAPTNIPVAETGTLDGSANPIVWDTLGKAVDSKGVVIPASRSLVILHAVVGFHGTLTVTSTGGTGYTLTLPAGSIYGDGSSLNVTLTLKDQFSVYYDGTYYWWSLITAATTLPAIPLAAALSVDTAVTAAFKDLSAALVMTGTPDGDLSI